MNCLELTRTDAIFSRIAFGVFLLCRAQKFVENSRKNIKRIFQEEQVSEAEDPEGGPPQEQGRAPPAGGP